MEQIHTHNPKLADTLTALSVAPTRNTDQSLPRNVRWMLLGISVIAVAAFTGIAHSTWPTHVEGAKLARPDQSDPAPSTFEMSVGPTIAPKGISPTATTIPVTAIQEIAGSGYIVAPQSTAVFAKYGGAIRSIPIDLGEWVEAGQIITILENAHATFAFEQAQAELVSAKLASSAYEIELVRAQDLFERTSALAARGVVPGFQLDDATSTLRAAQNAVAQGDQDVALAELAVRIAREPVDALSLRAPISGTVTALNATTGDTVLGRLDGQSILTITNTDALFIDADVAEANIALLHAGLRGEAVLDGFPNQPFSIVLTRIAPEVSAAKGTVTIRLTFDAPPTGIRPNMAARIRIFATQPETH